MPHVIRMEINLQFVMHAQGRILLVTLLADLNV
jgi:hypothetical protein